MLNSLLSKTHQLLNQLDHAKQAQQGKWLAWYLWSARGLVC